MKNPALQFLKKSGKAIGYLLICEILFHLFIIPVAIIRLFAKDKEPWKTPYFKLQKTILLNTQHVFLGRSLFF